MSDVIGRRKAEDGKKSPEGRKERREELARNGAAAQREEKRKEGKKIFRRGRSDGRSRAAAAAHGGRTRGLENKASCFQERSSFPLCVLRQWIGSSNSFRLAFDHRHNDLFFLVFLLGNFIEYILADLG